jgi:16S rRNA (uracil1498-N3)-methyltransferase
MHIFYIANISGSELIMEEKESKHAVKVLRLKKGNHVNVVDGRGGFYNAVITEANPKKCRLSVLHSQQEYGKRNFKIHIAIAPTKNIVRFEWFLEKATEIGIDEITPVLTEHSERKTIKDERLQKIVISAMKQSQKAYLPKINQLTSFDKLIKYSIEKEKFIAHYKSYQSPHLKNIIKKETDVLILIGPEGDFSPEELQSSFSHGFKEIILGHSRLRTETAGVVACLVVNLNNE